MSDAVYKEFEVYIFEDLWKLCSNVIMLHFRGWQATMKSTKI